jgi:hypothetical protein
MRPVLRTAATTLIVLLALTTATIFAAPAPTPRTHERGVAVSMDLTDLFATVADIERQVDPFKRGVALRLLENREDGAGYKQTGYTETGFQVTRRYSSSAREVVDTLLVYESPTMTEAQITNAEAFDVLIELDGSQYDRYAKERGHPPQGATREWSVEIRLNNSDRTAINNT